MPLLTPQSQLVLYCDGRECELSQRLKENLRQLGYTIVARNYRLSSGRAEADIIARDGEDLVVVEVKTRESDVFGPPERAVGRDKLRHMSWVANEYAWKSKTPASNSRKANDDGAKKNMKAFQK